MAVRRQFVKHLVVPGLLVFCLAALSGCSGNPASSASAVAPGDRSANLELFRDVTAQTGIDFAYHNGEESQRFAILETLGGGVALLDYDGDGLLDIFVAGGGAFEGTSIQGHPGKLFKNLGHWHFRDVTSEAGLDQPRFYTHGCAMADYDRDGWPD